MNARRLRFCIAAIALAGALALIGALPAGALFNDGAGGGPMVLASATLAAPSAVSAAQTNCRTNKSPEIKVEWTASSSGYLSTYAIERRTGATGSYATVTSVSASHTAYTDKSAALESSTTYYYRVAGVYRSWSAASSAVSVKTLSKSCQ